VEVLPSARRNKVDGPLDAVPALRNAPSFPVTEDGFLVIDKFNSDSGLAEGKVPAEIGSIDVLRLYVQQNSDAWVILSEVTM